MSKSESQEIAVNEAVPKKGRGAGRTRVFAIVVFVDSAPDGWVELLILEHVAVLISPLHDKDTNPDGTPKKAHWHVLVMFDSVKSQEQVDAMWDRVLGPNRVKHYETVNSTRGYGRYLCHLDNPEKYQYDKCEVQAYGGADYEAIISLPSDDWAVLDEIFDFIETERVRYYSDLMKYARAERRDWWKLLVQRHSYAVVQYMKSEEARAKEEAKELERSGRKIKASGYVDPATGEVCSPADIAEAMALLRNSRKDVSHENQD